MNSDTKSMISKSNEASVKRLIVPENLKSWSISWLEYKPIEYTSERVLSKPVWADPEDVKGIKFNEIDNGINRISYSGKYKFDIKNGRPLNPVKRTGMSGRGRLGKWGPNHAADAVVTRWKKDKTNEIFKHPISGKPVLEFIAVCRARTKEWVLPGGMNEKGENIIDTAKREFLEEATNSLLQTHEINNSNKSLLHDFLNNGKEIYRGYVDDPRNTDNAWTETTVYNFHDGDNKILNNLNLCAGDDAGNVAWMEIHSKNLLNNAHKNFIKLIADSHNAHWDSDGSD